MMQSGIPRIYPWGGSIRNELRANPMWLDFWIETIGDKIVKVTAMSLDDVHCKMRCTANTVTIILNGEGYEVFNLAKATDEIEA